MIDFFSKTRGAVSIFLVIILLPTMALAGIFVDLSRTKVAQEPITSSAELAINTVLSQYDTKLKDYFGLLASSQNPEEAINLSKQYFVDCMVSAGVDTSTAGTYVNNITNSILGEKDITDMLQLSLDGEVNINKTKNGAMNNPAILKKSIIEFMKYRAPINGVVSLFEKMNNNGVKEQLENISKETEMIEAKKKFYEAKEALYDQAQAAYDAIKEYENYETHTKKKPTDERYLDDFSQFIMNPDGTGKGFQAIYQEAHEKLVRDLYNTHDPNGTNSINLIKKKAISNPGKVRWFSSTNKANKTHVKTRLKNFNSALKTYEQRTNELNTAWSNVGKRNSADYPIQYWVSLTKECKTSYENYAIAANDLWKTALSLENAVDYAGDDVMDTEITDIEIPNDLFQNTSSPFTFQKVYYILMENTYNGSIKSVVTHGGTNSFKSITNEIASLDTSENNQKLNLSNISNIYNIRNKTNSYINDFKKLAKLSDKAKDETNKLKDKLDTYKQAFEKWEKVAKNSQLDDSDLAKEDREEIKKLKEQGIDLFSKTAVKKLVERLKKIHILFNTFQEDLNNIKYFNTKIVDISSYSKIRSIVGLDTNRIVRSNLMLTDYVDKSFAFSIGTKIQQIIIYDNKTSEDLGNGDEYVITDSFHPNLEKTELVLYKWLKEEIGNHKSGKSLDKNKTGFDAHDKKSAKNNKKSISDKSESADSSLTTENLKGHNFSEWSGATLPSSGAYPTEKLSIGTKLTEVSKFTQSLFSDFSSTFGNTLVNARDDLFATDYLFSMFTYDTFDKEGCYEKLDDSVKSTLKPKTAQSIYNSKKSDWKDSKENKTLTLTPRNSANNWAYGGEIEYILYGNKSNSENKATAYSKIYMLRYALDMPIVFKEYYNDPTLQTVAIALEAFAFIPQSLTKTLACLAITAAEAEIDVSYLKQGLPVLLIKKTSDLYCSYSSVFTGADKNIISGTDDKRVKFQYSDYLKLFTFMKLVGNSEKIFIFVLEM